MIERKFRPVTKINKTARKMDELIEYSILYKTKLVHRKRSNKGSNTLRFIESIFGSEILYANTYLFSYEPKRNSEATVKVGSYRFDIREYTKDEIFNLLLLHDTNTINWLQVVCAMKYSKDYDIVIRSYISQEYIFDAVGAYSTQYYSQESI